ncbi:MAG: hypothetical protein CVU56_29055 [Deltaproteobacteria bacterium HGW-Deltaproteobacteria-14]|nr:MAG: hypothetical protein CVU56_29055 [Deltaproteobacteria bacterium HGW-Deltaproteobacteria-14]
MSRSETGFELHAEVRVPSHDRGALERLCRYMARPPIAEDRLVRREDGRVELRLKRAWKGGVRALVFEPRELRPRDPPMCAWRPSSPCRITMRGSSSGSSRPATRSATASSRSHLLQPLSGLWPPSARAGWDGRTCSAACGTSIASGARGAAGGCTSWPPFAIPTPSRPSSPASTPPDNNRRHPERGRHGHLAHHRRLRVLCASHRPSPPPPPARVSAPSCPPRSPPGQIRLRSHPLQPIHHRSNPSC